MSRKKYLIFSAGLLLIFTFLATLFVSSSDAGTRPNLYWGNTGQDVRVLQWKLQSWGYYNGNIDGFYGNDTVKAVKRLQLNNGIAPDGVVGQRTWSALGLGYTTTATAAPASKGAARGVSNNKDLNLLAHLVHGEAEAEPFVGKVAVAAVILNRTQDPKFPKSVAGVVYQPGAFESVSNGRYNGEPSAESRRAAQSALNGWDPAGGALFFWNPVTSTSKWIWSRKITLRIGKHVFGF